MFNVENKVIAITGASSGIGEATAKLLAQNGANVDVIFNNAGVMPLSPMNALKVEEWDNMINVNIRGILNGIAAGLPIMEAQGGGQIINTASIGVHWRPLVPMW